MASPSISLILVGDLVDRDQAHIQTGPFGTQLKASEYVEFGTPVINVRNIGMGSVRQAQLEFVNDAKAENLSAHTLKIGDIVFGRKGAVDRHALITPDQDGWIQGSDCIRLRFNCPSLSTRFVSHYFRTQSHRHWMEAQGSFGATMASLNQGIIKRIAIPDIPYPEQRKIAAILTAYDDLIENNRQRIALLEAMAEEIYREWFVRLRFPGHQHTPIHKGVPEGWIEEPVVDAFDFTGGGTPSKKESRFWNPQEIDWYTPSDITASNGTFLFESAEKCSEEGLRNSSARLFPAYSVMLTSRATIGAIGINTTPAATNQGFITCIPNERFPLTFLYHWLKLAKPHFEMLSSGATFAELTKGTFKKIRILRPTDELVARYEAIARSNFDSIELLSRQNANLQRTRDLLLNRLISGKLRVDDLEICFPPSMSEAS
ncbi:MAG: restriction endonuclease subunit S [Xanthomonadales bacterium]|nr:restriction endonuclease subunit S [Xanthomonadales bacterium]